MATDNKRKLYDALSQDYDMGSYEQFCADLNDEDKRRKLYDATSQDYDLGTWDSFSQQLGYGQTEAEPAPAPERPATPTTTAKEIGSEIVSGVGGGNIGSALKREVGTTTSPEQQLSRIQARNDAMFASGKERLENMSEYFGSNPIVQQTVEGKPVFNPETSKMDKTYLTPTGERTTNKADADAVRTNFRQYVAAADMSVGAQIRRAEAELQQLSRTRMERSKQIAENAEKTDNGGMFSTYGRAISISQSANQDNELRAIDVAIRQREEQLKNLYEERDRQIGKDVGFWRGFGRTVSDLRTWDFGISELRDAATMLHADQYSSPNATEGEKRAGQEMLKAVYDAQQTEQMFGENASFWNRAGVMTGYMPSFMLDFALTGGGYEAINITAKYGTKLAEKYAFKYIGREALEEIAKKGVIAYIEKEGIKGTGKLAGNWLIKTVGALPDELFIRAPLMTNTIQAGKTTADIIDRKLGDVFVDDNGNYDFTNDKTWGSAIWQGEANAIIENYSEMFGTHLEGVVPALAATFGGKRVSGMLARANASSYGKILETTREHFKRLGVSDYFGEVGEEYYGQMWRTMLNLDDAYTNVPVYDEQGNQVLDADGNPVYERKNLLFTGQFHGDIWGGMALSMGLMGAGKYTVSGIAYGNMKHQVNVADRVAAEIFTPDRWEPIRKTIDNTTNEHMGALAEIMVNDPNLSDEERAAVMGYMERSLNLRGLNLGAMARGRDSGNNGIPEAIDIDTELSQSYIDGYEASSPQEMNDAQNMYEYQRQRLITELGSLESPVIEDILKDIDNDAVGALLKTHDPQLREVVLDYVNAKTVRDGIIHRVNDDIDEQIAQSDAMINARINQVSGMIQPAVMGLDDRQVYIVGGTLAVNEDGTIDRDASDESIVVRDAVTGELEFADPKSIVSAGEAIDPYMEKAIAVDNIRQQAAQAAADAMNGTLAFNPGDVVTISVVGGQAQVSIVGNAIDEESGMPINDSVVVRYENGTEDVFTKAELQELSDRANLERLNNFEQERAASRAEQRAAEAEAKRPKFALNDEFTILNDSGTPIRGSITGELDEDGTVEIYTEEPINGNRVNRLTPAELEEMFDTYNGETIQTPQQIESGNIDEENIPENGNIEGENIPAEEEVIEPQASALSRIPLDERNKPIFTAVEPDLAWDGIVEKLSDEESAIFYAQGMVKKAGENLERASKAKPKHIADIDEFEESERQRKSAIVQAKAEFEAWNAIAGIAEQRRAQEAEAKRQAELAARLEAEQEQRRIARQQQEEAERQQQLDREEKARTEGSPAVFAKIMANWDKPTTVSEYILRQLASGSVKLRWESTNNGKGIHASIFGGRFNKDKVQGSEWSKRRWLIDDRDGLTVDKYIERVAEEFYNDYEMNSDHSQEVSDAVHDVLLHYDTSKSMYEGALSMQQEVRSNDDSEAAEMQARGISEEDLALMDAYYEKYGMSEEDWAEFYSAHGYFIDLSEAEYQESITTLAEQIITEENERQGQIADAANESGEEGAVDNSTSLVPERGLHERTAGNGRELGNRQESGIDVPTGHEQERSEIEGGEVAAEDAITLINSIFDENGHLIDAVRLTELGLSAEQQSKLRAIATKRTKGWEFDATGRTSTIKIGGQDGFELTQDEKRELGRLNAKYNAGIISRKELSEAHTALGNRVAERISAETLHNRPSKELDENGLPFILSDNGTTSFGIIRENSGLPSAPIKLSEGYQDETGSGYGLRHIEAGHGEEIRNAGFSTVEEFVSYVARNYDEDNIRVGKKRKNGNTTYLIQVTDSHDNTLFIELSKDSSYWNVNSGGIFRKGYSNKKETVAKTEPQQPNNAVSSSSSLSIDEQSGISSIEPNGEPTVSDGKDNTLQTEKQESISKGSLGDLVKAAEAEVNTDTAHTQKDAGNIKRQAEREDGQLLILPSETSEEAGALSGPTFDLPNEKMPLSSERYLTEAPSETERPDLVPTSDNVSSDRKGSTLQTEKQDSGSKGSIAGQVKGAEAEAHSPVEDALTEFAKRFKEAESKGIPAIERELSEWMSQQSAENLVGLNAEMLGRVCTAAGLDKGKAWAFRMSIDKSTPKELIKEVFALRSKRIKEQGSNEAEFSIGADGISDSVTYEAAKRLVESTGIEVIEVDESDAEAMIELNKGGRILGKRKGRVYGWTVGGKVYLNRDAMNPETPLHEYTHLWDEMIARENPELWEHGKALLKQTPLWDEVKNDPNYADIHNDEDALASEVHSRLTSKEGAKLLHEMIEESRKEGAMATAEAVTLVQSIKKWFKDMFIRLKETLKKWSKKELRTLTLEDFNGMTLRDLIEGMNPYFGDRSLAGVHNITEQKLLKALRIGGLVNPSVAIINVNEGKHDDYGEISLLLPSSMIDKQRGSSGAWPGDAWTPTYPAVERRMKSEGADLPSRDIAKLPGSMQDYTRRSFDGWLDGRSYQGLAYWFLTERGEAPEVVRRKRTYTVQEASRILHAVKEKDEFGGLKRKPLSELTDEERSIVRTAYIKYEYEGNEEEYNKRLEEKRQIWEKLVAENKEGSLRYMRGANNLAKLEQTGLMPEVESWLNEVQADINAGNREEPELTSLEANKILNDKGLQDEFEAWVDRLTDRYGIEEVIFDGYTPSGERRYVKNTAKNASRIMREQGKNGATGWSSSFSRFVAAVLKPMNKREDIRKEKHRLTSNHDDLDAFDAKWSDVFFELGMKCQPDAAGRFDDYGMERLVDAVSQKNPISYLEAEYGVKLSTEDAMRLMSMIESIRKERPAMYFEKKYERPVQLNEFAAAVIPHSAGNEVRSALAQAGVRVIEYAPANKTDRKRALLEASGDNVRFQIIGEKGARNKDESETADRYRRGDGYGAYSDAEVSFANDPISKVMGKNRFSKKRQAEFAARERERMVKRIEELASKLHLDNLEIVTDASQLEGKRAKAKGFYNKRTGKITIVIPNNVSTIDAEQTLLHEAVAHYGLRKLFGEQFNTFLDNVYQSADESIRRKIAEMAAQNGWDFRTATEEYLAGLAEDTNFREAQNYTGWWSKIKRLFLDMLDKIGFEGFRDKVGVVLTDNELRYILWRSYENLAEPGRYRSILGEAADVAKQSELKVGNYAEQGVEVEYAAEASDIEGINERFNEELEQQLEGRLPEGHVYEMGMPSKYLRSTGIEALPIRLSAKILNIKSNLDRHSYSLEAVKNLVKAIQKPWAIFAYGDKAKAQNLIIGIEDNGRQFLVGLSIKPTVKGRTLEINSIRNVFPKNNHEWVNWINEGKLLRVDGKEEIQTVIAKLRMNPAAFDYLDLDNAAKIVETFENPTIEDEESLLYRGAEGSARKEYDRRVRVKVVDKDKQKTKRTNRAAQLNEAYLDSMRSLRVLQEAIRHETGKEIEDFENAFIEENHMSSRNKTAEEVYQRDFFQPMCNAVADICKGKKEEYRKLLDYIIAKHGLERNAYMRAKDVANGRSQSKADATDYAGLTALTKQNDVAEAEAAAERLVTDYESAHNTTELWTRINAATAETLRTRYQGGLLSRDTYETIRNQYQNYIPLKGWNETTAADVYEYAAGNYGLTSALMTAHGRESIADDPLATIMVDAQRTIMEANRNLMKQKFLNLAINHQTNLLSISRQWYELTADGTWKPADERLDIPVDADADTIDALVKEYEAEMRELEKEGKARIGRQGLRLGLIKKNIDESQHVVKVKRNGETFCIYVNGDPRAARAINGMLNPDAGDKSRAAQLAQSFKDIISKTLTTWNPEFVVSNLSRDVMFAGVAVAVKEDGKYTRNYTHNISSILAKASLPRLLYKWEHGTLDNSVEIERYFREFLMNGGETGFTQLNTVDKVKKDMQRFLSEAQGNASYMPRKAWRGFWNGIEFLNRSAEDTTRFAVYMTSRQQGRSISRSIHDAKEITVNFNKKGSGAWGARTLNFLYVFFNAAMQALANAGRLVYRNPGKASVAMGVFMSSGFFVPILSCLIGALTSGDGDDDEYWNQPEWVRRNNILIRIPFTKHFLTIPIAHELRPFYGIGEIAYSVMCGKETIEDGLWKAAEGFTGIIPIDFTGNGGNLLVNFTPTIGQPVAQVKANVDYFGKPIYRDTPWNQDDPEWMKAYKGTNGLLVDLSRMLSEAGSTTDEYGVVSYPKHWYTGDVNPAVLEHLLESYTGGLGKTINGMSKTISMLWNEDARELRNVPVVRKFLQSSDERAEASRFSKEYFKLRDEYEESKKYLRQLGNLDDEGALGVADRVSRWLDTDAGKRHELLDDYFKELRRYQRELNNEDRDSIRHIIESDIDSVRRELVHRADSIRVSKE